MSLVLGWVMDWVVQSHSVRSRDPPPLIPFGEGTKKSYWPEGRGIITSYYQGDTFNEREKLIFPSRVVYSNLPPFCGGKDLAAAPSPPAYLRFARPRRPNTPQVGKSEVRARLAPHPAYLRKTKAVTEVSGEMDGATK